jgi:hypothetical protein
MVKHKPVFTGWHPFEADDTSKEPLGYNFCPMKYIRNAGSQLATFKTRLTFSNY